LGVVNIYQVCKNVILVSQLCLMIHRTGMLAWQQGVLSDTTGAPHEGKLDSVSAAVL
jgi:hypothetical protein